MQAIKHEDYLEMRDQWRRIDDVLEGEDAVKQAGTRYLPKLPDQEDADYRAYKQRSMFYSATSRTAESYMGLIFRKPVRVDLPGELEAIENRIGIENESVDELAKEVVRSVINKGRCAVLVDYPAVSADRELTRAEAQDIGMYPYAALYETEKIVNWRTQQKNGQKVLTDALLEEDYTSDTNMGFPTEEKTQYRRLTLNDNGEYIQQIMRTGAEKDGFYEHEKITPLKDGEPLDHIPLYFAGVSDNTPAVEKPPLLDLVNANLSHYRTEADYEHGLHWTALPTLTITGADPDEIGDIALGPEGGIVLESPDAEAKMLEFQGKGLEQIESALDRKEEIMADMGARLIMDLDSSREAAETVRLRQQGQNSVLGNIADTCEKAMQWVLVEMAEWMNAEADEVNINITKEFMPATMDHRMVQALMSAVQEGRITQETFVQQMQKADIIDESESVDDYIADLEQQRLEEPPELQ